MGDKLREALAGDRTFDEIRSLLGDALTDTLCPDNEYSYVWIRDLSDEWVAYTFKDDTFKAPYTVADDGSVTIGEPLEVEVRTSYTPLPDDSNDTVIEPADDGADGADGGDLMPMAEGKGKLIEGSDRINGRLIEAKGLDDTGGRVFAVQVIAAGDSKNGRRYPESVLRSAMPLYEGAKAYDHHRTAEELQTSTIQGLIGSYRSVVYTGDGLQADLHLLPSAAHTAEALDASLANQEEGLPPLVGISHDVMGRYRPINAGGRRLQEATSIDKVNSADVVADPAAGGKATRMVAGGTGTATSPEEDTVTIEELLALINGATPEQRAATLEGLGIDVTALEEARRTEAAPPPPVPQPPTAGALQRDSVLGRTVVSGLLQEAKLDGRLAEAVMAELPESFTEADVTSRISTLQRVVENLERASLAPGVPHVDVTQDAVDKKRARLDAFFAGDFREGYHSFKQAFCDFTGANPFTDVTGEDFNRKILRESIGDLPWDSARSTESVQASTWNLALGDSITRRLIAMYQQPNLQTWRQVVSSIVPLTDFRTQRIDRVGGYGTLPTVNEGAPYQPLTSPGNEEITYALAKKGGTEDLTLETIANDDVRLIVRIPQLLGLAAAETIYRFVWDFIDTNATCSYDSTALFAAGHGSNTATNALNQANVSVGRKAMRKQSAYGDTKQILSITPKYLVTVSDLEELAWQICNSAVAVGANGGGGSTTTGANVTNVPNIHAGMTPLVVDYWSSTTKWVLLADPSMVPTFELGFYQGRQDPELFVQNDPTVGASFTSDKITWKIRHMYSGAILDHRGMYRGNT